MEHRDAARGPCPARLSPFAVARAITWLAAVVGPLALAPTPVAAQAGAGRPAAAAPGPGPSAAEVAALKKQLGDLQAQLASMSSRAASIPRTEATAASADVAEQQLSQANASADSLRKALSTIQPSLPSSPATPEQNAEFERIKYEIQKLSQMQQALSNVLNTMDELARQAIRHLKV